LQHTASSRGRKTNRARQRPGLAPPVLRPAFLFEEFGDGPPHAPPRDSVAFFERGRVATVQKLYLLFKSAQGFSSNRIALDLGISRSSAKRVLAEARNDTENLYLWGFVVAWRTETAVKYFCRYCAWTESRPQDAAMHAYGHIWDPRQMKVSPMG
jgi:hypothetical protein